MQEALNRQLRPTAAELGIAHVEPYSDAESDLETLDIRLEYALAELTQVHIHLGCHYRKNCPPLQPQLA